MMRTLVVTRRDAIRVFSPDEVIRGFSTWPKTISRPIYLRIGYEFDGAQNELEPSEYVTDRYRKQSPQLFGQLGFAP